MSYRQCPHHVRATERQKQPQNNVRQKPHSTCMTCTIHIYIHNASVIIICICPWHSVYIYWLWNHDPQWGAHWSSHPLVPLEIPLTSGGSTGSSPHTVDRWYILWMCMAYTSMMDNVWHMYTHGSLPSRYDLHHCTLRCDEKPSHGSDRHTGDENNTCTSHCICKTVCVCVWCTDQWRVLVVERYILPTLFALTFSPAWLFFCRYVTAENTMCAPEVKRSSVESTAALYLEFSS